MLFEAYGKVGFKKALKIIRRKVSRAIRHAYPELREECNQQAARRNIDR